MKVQVIIPISVYKSLEKHAASGSYEFNFLKNGIITDDRSDLAIRCDSEQALRFIAWARQKVPESAGLIGIKPEA